MVNRWQPLFTRTEAVNTVESPGGFYTEAEVNAPDRFESDFMVQYLADKELSKEAKAVLDAGRPLWQ